MSDESVPSAKLAALTVDRLIQSGLLRAEKRDALVAKIAGGTMKGDDWKLEIDLASAKAAN
jgi:chemotaxis receptor (MCP) glutamine deamidase CheD